MSSPLHTFKKMRYTCREHVNCTGFYSPECKAEAGDIKVFCIGETEKINPNRSCFFEKLETNCPPYETTYKGGCKCGDADTCYGKGNGLICDKFNSQCVCSLGEPACEEGKKCRDGKCSVDGNWGDWSKYGVCVEEMGYKWRNRSCNNPAPEGNGRKCPGSREDKKKCVVCNCNEKGAIDQKCDSNGQCDCKNDRIDGFKCDSCKPGFDGFPNCNKVNGEWSHWKQWSVCSKSCGKGSQTRKRMCDNPPPSNGGRNCIGKTTESKECMLAGCPEKCYWDGEAPFCGGRCPHGFYTKARDKYGDGKKCWSGEKHYCCKK